MRNLIALAFIAFGCGDNTGTNPIVNPDSGVGCVQGTTECVNASLAQVCSGGVWLAKPCGPGSTCMNGDCTAAGVPCTPGSSICGDSTTSLTCNINGFGYTATTCPTGTVCAGAGFCVGSCIVGLTKCSGNQLLTCADGFTFTATNCAPDTLCVNDFTRPNTPGICVKGDCTPDLINGCNSVCGLMGPSPSPAATNFISTCTNTNSPLGWRWQAVQCTGAKTCDPVGTDCPNTTRKQQAACVSQCTPGSVRCANSSSATQTCDANGNWSPAVLCPGGQVCSITIAGLPSTAVCADPPCSTGAFGVCIDVGGVSEILTCTNGKLAATPTVCSFGTCLRDFTITLPVAGFTAGICAAECQMGDQICGSDGVRVCTPSGLWASTVTPCPATTSCNPYTDSITGKPKGICGACSPGGRRCVDAGGTPAGGPLPDFEICDPSGQWGPPIACTLGQCTNGTAGLPPCQVDCLPGSFVCVGALTAPSPLPGIPYPGTSAAATCTAQGLNPGAGYPATVGTDPCWIGSTPPAGVTCCSVTGGGIFGSCRRDVADSTGGAIGCVACVGAGTNEAGLIDTRCSNDTGTDIGNAAIQMCAANNSGWGPAVLCSVGTCHPPLPSPGPVPPSQINPSCNLCNISGAQRTCTDANWNLFGGSSCVNAGFGGVMSCGTSADCCAAACYITTPPTPALCSG